MSVAVLVGALFPSLGDSMGDVSLPDGASCSSSTGSRRSAPAPRGWRYLSAFHYYANGDPLTTGVYLGGLAVLAASALALTAAAVAGFARRDLRG